MAGFGSLLHLCSSFGRSYRDTRCLWLLSHCDGRMQRELMETYIGELALLCAVIKVDRRLLHLPATRGCRQPTTCRSMRWDPRLMLRSVAGFGYSSVLCFVVIFLCGIL